MRIRFDSEHNAHSHEIYFVSVQIEDGDSVISQSQIVVNSKTREISSDEPPGSWGEFLAGVYSENSFRLTDKEPDCFYMTNLLRRIAVENETKLIDAFAALVSSEEVKLEEPVSV